MTSRRMAILVSVLVALAAACGGSSDDDPAAPPATDGAGDGSSDGVDSTLDAVEYYAVTERNHVDTLVDYPTSPPYGGNHLPFWQNCGAYRAPVLEEAAVHSLEHGVVWLTWRPDVDPAPLEALAASDDRLLVSPLEGQEAPVVATAWGRQLALTGPDDPRLTAFVAEFQDAETAPEPGFDCSGALGQPPDLPMLLPNGQNLSVE